MITPAFNLQKKNY